MGLEYGYFYVTFHGYDYIHKLGVRGVAKTVDFVNWITDAPDIANGMYIYYILYLPYFLSII